MSFNPLLMQSKFTRVQLPKIKIALALFSGLILLILLIKGVLVVQSFIDQTGLSPGTIIQLAFKSGAALKIIKGRTNILLLGVAGGAHDGTDLTDTILVLSFTRNPQSLSMISLPRDLWSDTLKDKVNSAYHYGEMKKKGGGLVLSRAIVSDMVGLPIDYALMFDFSRFRDIINLVGGVSVNVPIAFTDSEYPIAGREKDECGGDPKFFCRYELLHFDAGVQTMDGDRALKYVRSRHAEGDEGSDFARSKRQQEVLLALKEKITSKQVLLDPHIVGKLYAAFESATDTDMNIGELLTVGKLFVQMPKSSVQRISLEDQLYAPPSAWYGRYVLLPKESFESLHEYVNRLLK